MTAENEYNTHYNEANRLRDGAQALEETARDLRSKQLAAELRACEALGWRKGAVIENTNTGVRSVIALTRGLDRKGKLPDEVMHFPLTVAGAVSRNYRRDMRVENFKLVPGETRTFPDRHPYA